MTGNTNRFQDFFEAGDYVALKNHLYNYLLRKKAIQQAMDGEKPDLVLEAGCGISPVFTGSDRVVYSDLSLLACQSLRAALKQGYYVVADVTRLPFRPDSFSHTISSEVLEHVADDRAALRELATVIRPGGCMVMTFPHRKFYYAVDDSYIKHFRRYELDEMDRLLRDNGLKTSDVKKVLGPLEKLTMMFAVVLFHALQRFKKQPSQPAPQPAPGMATRAMVPLFRWTNRLYAAVISADAWLMPRKMAACLLIKARKPPLV